MKTPQDIIIQPIVSEKSYNGMSADPRHPKYQFRCIAAQYGFVYIARIR